VIVTRLIFIAGSVSLRARLKAVYIEILEDTASKKHNMLYDANNPTSYMVNVKEGDGNDTL